MFFLTKWLFCKEQPFWFNENKNDYNFAMMASAI